MVAVKVRAAVDPRRVTREGAASQVPYRACLRARRRQGLCCIRDSLRRVKSNAEKASVVHMHMHSVCGLR